MKPGDKLLTVNGESVLGYSLEKVEYAEDKQNPSRSSSGYSVTSEIAVDFPIGLKYRRAYCT